MVGENFSVYFLANIHLGLDDIDKKSASISRINENDKIITSVRKLVRINEDDKKG